LRSLDLFGAGRVGGVVNSAGTIPLVAPIVDLRSDTVTQPTPAMRAAMADAEVGDDGYGEDPTVNALQAAFAERMGMEAALFVPSGTMANQIALRLLTRPGDGVIAGRSQHLVAYEEGAGSRNAGVQFLAVDDSEGILDPATVKWSQDSGRNHQVAPGAVAIENTHMASGGRTWPVECLQAVLDAAGRLPVHVDGARIFNAEVATGVTVDRLVRGATTMMACLSKGLCCPVGSVLAASAEIVEQARFERRQLGGRMRQAGVLAAAGLVALDFMVSRLAEDHQRARVLADVVARRWPGCGLDPGQVTTNIVVFAHPDPPALLAYLAGRGVRAGTIAPRRVRLMTHHDVDDAGVAHASAALADAPL
jgi:threonine aldolase